MELGLSVYVTLGLLLLIFLLFFCIYWKTSKMFRGFTVEHIIPKLIYYHMTSKESNFSNLLLQVLSETYNKHYKDGLFMSYTLRPVLFIFGEEPIKVFTNNKAANKKSAEYKVFTDIADGLFTINGEMYKTHRKIIKPAFQLGRLKENVSLFNEHAIALVEDLKTLKSEQSTEYFGFLKRHYFNALNESIFGLKPSEKRKAEHLKFFHAVDNLLYASMYRIFQPYLWWNFTLNFFPTGRKFLRMYKELDSYIINTVLRLKNNVMLNKDSEDTNYSGKSLRNSVTYQLLQHHWKDPSFTLQEIKEEVTTLLITGYDTVSYTTLWCLFNLGLYPEVQEKAFQEISSAKHNYIDYEDMISFKYLEAVIMETLRLFPTGPIIARELTEDVHCGKYKVLKGTTVGFLSWFWHRNPDIYPDPEKFDPERFFNQSQRKSWTHIPFAEGNRMCIGKKYALIEMKIFLAHILCNFKIKSLDKREDVQYCWSTILTPAKPLRMFLHRDLLHPIHNKSETFLECFPPKFSTARMTFI